MYLIYMQGNGHHRWLSLVTILYRYIQLQLFPSFAVSRQQNPRENNPSIPTCLATAAAVHLAPAWRRRDLDARCCQTPHRWQCPGSSSPPPPWRRAAVLIWWRWRRPHERRCSSGGTRPTCELRRSTAECPNPGHRPEPPAPADMCWRCQKNNAENTCKVMKKKNC